MYSLQMYYMYIPINYVRVNLPQGDKHPIITFKSNLFISFGFSLSKMIPYIHCSGKCFEN